MTRIISRPGVSSIHSALPRDWRTVVADPQAPVPAQTAQILLQARQQARAIVRDAEEAAQASIIAERQAGWQQGYAEGRQQARQENAAVMQRLAQLVTNSAAAHEASARAMDRELASLAVTLARLIVQHEVACVPETVLHVAQAALRELRLEQAVVLRVHPDDAELLQAQLPALSVPETVRVSVLSDPLIAQGGCMAESGAGRVDATIEKQLERLERLLHEQLDAASV